MKNTRKLTALFAILCLLATLWAPTTVVAATPETAPQAAATVTAADPLDAPLELLAKLPNGDRLCAVYSLIMDAVRNGEEFIDFGDRYTLTEEEQLILQTAVDAAIPEGYGDYIGHSYCTVVDTHFYSWFYDWGLTTEMENAVDLRVAELTANLQGKSDLDKCRILYERLINANRYDFGNYHQTAYGALVEGMSVCAGYGRAYQMLLQAVGIPCLYVSGEANNGLETGGHAWNIVKLNGHWYYCDPTWDDSDNLAYGLDYAYFNISYAQISTNHFLEAGFELWVPKETAPAADYYTTAGLAVETLTLNQLIALFQQHNPLSLRILGDSETNAMAIVDLFYSNMHTIADALGAPAAGASFRGKGDYSVITLSLSLSHDHDFLWQIVEPTCTNYGQSSYTCKNCGEHGFESLDPLGHVVDLQWTCDEWYHTKSCTRCLQAIEQEEHTYEGGVCTVCGYTDSPCDHDYVATTVIEPSCEGWGLLNYTCRLCGDTYSETLPSTGHDFYTAPGQAPTCTTDGWTESEFCGICGFYSKVSETIPATGHDFTNNWSDATHHGVSCATCGEAANEEKHTFEDGICTVCGHPDTPVTPCDHDFTLITAIDPSCEGYGWYDYICQLCGHTYSETVFPTGHNFTNSWSDATHHGVSCTTCGKTDNEEEHTYEQNGKVCDTCGYVSAECHHQYATPCGRFCHFCGEEQLIDVAHTYDDDKDAVCNICGEERYIPTVAPGDANGDDKVNNRDLGLLQRHLNGWSVDINLEACDVNGDGKVNNRDLAMLQKQLNT